MKKIYKLVIVIIVLIVLTVTKLNNKYDVIVVSTEPEGISAAVASSRLGLKTLIVDERKRVGGLMTVGGLNSIDMNYSPDGEIITGGIFKEFLQKVSGGDLTKTSFNINEAEEVFNEMLNNEKNIDKKLGVKNIEPIMKKNKVLGIKIDGKKYYCKKVIDASKDADIAAMSGVPYSKGMEDMGVINENQVVTLVFEVSGVNWEKIKKSLTEDDDIYSGADNVSAWGFLDEMRTYKAIDNNIRMRGLNIGRQDEDTILINAMHIFGVDSLDENSIKLGYDRATKELANIIVHMRSNIPGFENAYISEIMDELYIRESRHIYGEYRLTIDDVISSRNFEDKIAYGSYSVDIQPTSIDNWGYVIGEPEIYTIPFRCIVPKNVENLLVASRSASYDSLPHGSARVIPIGMAVAEAAAVSANYSIKNNISFKQMTKDIKHIQKVQSILAGNGAYMKEYSIKSPYENHYAKDEIIFMLSTGLIQGGYENDFKLDDKVKGKTFQNLLNGVLKRVLEDSYKEEMYVVVEDTKTINKEDVATSFKNILGEKVTKNNYNDLLERGYILEKTDKELKDEDGLNKADVYMLIQNFILKLKGSN